MADEPQTTGTPEPDDGDAQETATTGTPAEDGRNADGESPISRDEALVWKTKAENYNRLEGELEQVRSENARLRERSEPPPAATDAETRTQMDELETRARAAAAAGDAVGEMLFRERAERLQLQNKIGLLFDAYDIDNKDERKETLKEFRSGRYGDMEAANAAVKARNLAAQLKEAQDKIAALTRSKPPADVVRTVHHEAPASNGSKMTEAQWESRQSKLPDRQRMLEQIARRDGRIVVDG